MNQQEKMERWLKIDAAGLFSVLCACVIFKEDGKSRYVDKILFS